MEFNDLIYNHFGDVSEERKEREDIPIQYQEFLPENITKTKGEYPYTYDPFLIYFNEKTEEEPTGTVYTDRLFQWDHKKHDSLCQEHFGDKKQYWDNRESKKIEKFLSDYFGRKIILIANIQYVNMSSGYPVWRLDYCEENPDK